MPFEINNVLDLCAAAKRLGNGAASAESIARLITEFHQGESLEDLFSRMIAKARHDLAIYGDALQVERWARIAGLTGEQTDFAEAIGLIPKIIHPSARARAKKLVVVAYLEAGMTDEAREFALTIKSFYWGAESWVEVYQRSKNPHDLQQARDRCNNIGDPFAQEEVQAQINAYSF